jgi:hypothetical protein
MFIMQFLQVLDSKDVEKQKLYSTIHNRAEYTDDILDHLTPADVKVLIKTCEEMRVTEEFSRIFPTAATHKYLTFIDEVTYYDKLLDSFMTYCKEKSFMDGVQLVRNMTLFHFPDGLASSSRRPPPSEVVRRQGRNNRNTTNADVADRKRATVCGVSEVKERLLQTRQSRKSAETFEWEERKRDSILNSGNLSRILPRTCSRNYPLLDRLTDEEIRARAAERTVSVATLRMRQHLKVLLYGDFVLQSLDANLFHFLGKCKDENHFSLFINQSFMSKKWCKILLTYVKLN